MRIALVLKDNKGGEYFEAVLSKQMYTVKSSIYSHFSIKSENRIYDTMKVEG